MKNLAILAFLLASGCLQHATEAPLPEPPAAVPDVRLHAVPETKLNVNQSIEELKRTPTSNAQSWSVSSPFQWSTFTEELPDNDSAPWKFAESFASRKCELTEVLKPTVQELATSWIARGGDDIVTDTRGIEIAVGGYRENGIVRLKVAFTKSTKP